MSSVSMHNAVVMRIDRRKSARWCDWKAEAWVAMFRMYYNIKLDFRIAPGKFECSADFLSCTHVNQYISSILHNIQCEHPQVCVIGDSTGAVVIPCLVQLDVEHACVVSLQDAASNDLLARNMNDSLKKTSKYLRFRRAACGYGDARVQTEPAAFSSYTSLAETRELLGTRSVSLHNRHPWEFMKWCPRGFHFHVLYYWPVWNGAFQEKLCAIKAEMDDSTRRNNFSRGIDVDLENDLAFAAGEASPLKTLQNMDRLFINEMHEQNMTCDVIVLQIRGKVSTKTWAELEQSGSALARTYAIVCQIEEFPNERDERLVWNPKTNEYDQIPDMVDRGTRRRMKQSKDVNGGIRGQIHSIILRNRSHFNGEEPTCEYKSCRELRPRWYGPYMNIRDSAKQAIYVRTTTHEVPCQMISPGGTKLDVILEKQLKGMELDASQYTKIPARRRRIEVQIADLSFYEHAFERYKQAFQAHKSIPLKIQTEIKTYVEQCEYTYKYIDSCKPNSQSERGDTDDRKLYGAELIRTKLALFKTVNHLRRWIESHNNWQLPDIPANPLPIEELLGRLLRPSKSSTHTGSKRRGTRPTTQEHTEQVQTYGLQLQGLFPNKTGDSKPTILGWSVFDEGCHWYRSPNPSPDPSEPSESDNDDDDDGWDDETESEDSRKSWSNDGSHTPSELSYDADTPPWDSGEDQNDDEQNDDHSDESDAPDGEEDRPPNPDDAWEDDINSEYGSSGSYHDYDQEAADAEEEMYANMHAIDQSRYGGNEEGGM